MVESEIRKPVVFYILCFSFLLSCSAKPKTIIGSWTAYDESQMLANVAEHENRRMRLKLIQSKVQDKNKIWDAVRDDLQYFSEEDYERLYPFIYERDILQIQFAISEGHMTYAELTQWYLYRIVKIENDSSTTLHTIIALNPDAYEQAKQRDREKNKKESEIYGMPVLLKDNINSSGMPTTAGAIALQNNITEDAEIVKRLKSRGAIILGKVNLSEWAYYFCGGCPVGYSAIGGQTLNPYGRGVLETGGSSAGSGTSVAANYAVGAVGTETSGSILSPSGKNSVVGMKPTIGILSRSGIVPISSTLDTPGPMTRNVTDNAILLAAMSGEDKNDPATLDKNRSFDYVADLRSGDLRGKRFGAIKRFMEDSLYLSTLERLRILGATIIEYEAPEITLDRFGTLLDADMKRDLPLYLKQSSGNMVSVESVADVIVFNLEDTLIRAPYGQVRLEGSAQDTTSDEGLSELSQRLENDGRRYFDIPFKEHSLDAILSIDNYSAGFAAVAKYPCLTIPMGYKNDGSPSNLTFIGPAQSEAFLLQIGYAYEQGNPQRKPPF